MSSWIGQKADELAAGDEVEDVESVLRHISGQLAESGFGDSVGQDPLGHIVVPSSGAGIAVPEGDLSIDFKNGQVTHSALDGVVAEITKIRELSRSLSDSQLNLRNIILHADSLASMTVQGSQNQDVFFQDVPIPFRGFETVEITLSYPCELSVLASTQELPIGLGAITAHGQRHGEHADAITDSFEAVPVAPFDLWDDHGDTHAKAEVYAAQFDDVTITVDNTSAAANDLDAEVQAKEHIDSSSAEWRTIDSSTAIPQGDHSIFSISERHKLLRTRVTNNVTGESVAASVDYNLANP